MCHHSTIMRDMNQGRPSGRRLHGGKRRKRAAVAPSCTELVWDELFDGAWLARKRDAGTDSVNAL